SFTHLQANKSGPGVAYVAESPNLPPHLVAGGSKINPNAHILELDKHTDLSVDRLFWYSKDGTKVCGTLYHLTRIPDKKPLIVLIHSDPFARHNISWPLKARYLCSLGFTVLYVNYRGSAGYGRAYSESLRGEWIGKATDDIAGAFGVLTTLPHVDVERCAIWGGDVAAMTALHTVQKYPSLFNVAVLVYPTFSPNPREPMMRFLLGDRTVGELRKTRQKSSCSFLIFQGAKDTRAKLSDTQELVDTLQTQNAVEFKVFDDEGHRWQHRQTYEVYYEMVVSFLRKRLFKHPSIHGRNREHPDGGF
ncbi:MAG: alpha/beta hydrolase family protein, partial [Oligoflexales bacterium]